MSLLSKIAGAFTGGLADSIADVADKFIETPDEKRAFKLAVEQEISRRVQQGEETARAEINARAQVITAELQQDDLYTKRARPTLIYFGMLMIALNYFVVPLIQMISGLEISPFEIPFEFWVAWGGAVSVYTIGRSMEKKGSSSAFSQVVTGNRPRQFIEE
jgi:hypothetical protein